ncbi:single-stranded DNA-binding protein [Candidatus Nephthysia bennettiae]|uniref:Single-stranded DNA-binding protein n=1 Tax=Candidatus Nephthysia bennettiae TaxID=3127016 RepID=A0A934K8R1_9BACT|nr:single-stranded DNA-binding protein [Candidatus Dormibacteraeota bacterium]
MGDVVNMQNGTAETTERTGGRGPALNEVRLLGRLTAAPELRYMPNGGPVCELRLATNERQEPEYHDVTVYGKLAETIAQHQVKGSQLLVSGRLHAQTWTAQDGGNRRRVVVIAESAQFLARAGQ